MVARLREGEIVAVASSDHDLTHEAIVMLTLAEAPHPNILPLLSVEYGAKREISLVIPLARFGTITDLADALEFEGKRLTMADASTDAC